MAIYPSERRGTFHYLVRVVCSVGLFHCERSGRVINMEAIKSGWRAINMSMSVHVDPTDSLWHGEKHNLSEQTDQVYSHSFRADGIVVYEGGT